MDAPLRYRDPVSESNDYHAEQLEEAKALLASLEALTPEEGFERGKKELDENIKQYQGYLASYERENQVYDEMAKQVKAWQPPTADHIPLKNFMLEQLSISLHDLAHTKRHIAELFATDPGKYLEDSIGYAKRDVKYHSDELKKSIQKKKEFNSDVWIDRLCESLGVPTPEKPCQKK